MFQNDGAGVAVLQPEIPKLVDIMCMLYDSADVFALLGNLNGLLQAIVKFALNHCYHDLQH